MTPQATQTACHRLYAVIDFNPHEVQMLAQSYRYITAVPGMRSGSPIVKGTRIGVHDVVGLILNGAGVDEVQRSFPLLTRSQVYECMAYYEDNQEEIESLVARQMALAD